MARLAPIRRVTVRRPNNGCSTTSAATTKECKMTSMLTIDTLDGTGSFNAYCAEPAGPPRAASIVIQEIFGVNAGIRRKCDRLAADGYVAIAPDRFWRRERGIEPGPGVPEQFAQALYWIG